MPDRATQIRERHSRIEASIKRSLADAIEIGRLLHEQKDELPHGQFGKWLKANILGPNFSRSLATKYMKIYEDRETLQIRNVTNIATALRVAGAESKAKAADVVDKEFEDADDPPATELIELRGSPAAVQEFSYDLLVLTARKKSKLVPEKPEPLLPPLAVVHEAVKHRLASLEESND